MNNVVILVKAICVLHFHISGFYRLFSPNTFIKGNSSPTFAAEKNVTIWAGPTLLFNFHS